MGLINSRDYTVKSVDSFFLDTNIWLLLFGDIADYRKKEQSEYSKVLQSILSRDCIVFLTSSVISEFSNVLLRRSYNDWQSEVENVGKEFKKDFVGSESYLERVELISGLINKIIALPCVQRMPDDFNAVQLDRILERFKIIDFNDAYIAEICQSKSLKLVTNDRDFFHFKDEIDVISALR